MRFDPKPQSLFPSLGFGLGLRTDHFAEVLGGRSSVSWFEALTENYLGEGGRPIHVLEQVRRDVPIALHGVSLSIASVDPLNLDYLSRLKQLVGRIEPAIVSDHCCWTSFKGENLHDLMPVPFTEEAIEHVVRRVSQVQEFLGRRILLENVSSYLDFSHSEMTEWEFLSVISQRADCGLLLDVNNIYVSAVNHGFDPLHFLDGIPRARVGQIHLAGHSRNENEDGSFHLIDTHDAPVCAEVWDLYAKTVERFGSVTTMVEWDAHIPEYGRLEQEVLHAREIAEGVLAKKREANREL